MKSRIGKQDSKELYGILSRIKQLFDRYYDDEGDDQEIVGGLVDEVDELRAWVWYNADAKIAEIMDKEDGFERQIQQSRHPSTGFSEPKN